MSELPIGHPDRCDCGAIAHGSVEAKHAATCSVYGPQPELTPTNEITLEREAAEVILELLDELVQQRPGDALVDDGLTALEDALDIPKFERWGQIDGPPLVPRPWL